MSVQMTCASRVCPQGTAPDSQIQFRGELPQNQWATCECTLPGPSPGGGLGGPRDLHFHKAPPDGSDTPFAALGDITVPHFHSQCPEAKEDNSGTWECGHHNFIVHLGSLGI